MSAAPEIFDPKKRRLCPDGACIGVLDDAGRCKECGLSAVDVASLLEPDPSASATCDSVSEMASDFDPKRRLCPDGTCLGVLGKDGRCSVCQRGFATSDPPGEART